MRQLIKNLNVLNVVAADNRAHRPSHRLPDRYIISLIEAFRKYSQHMSYMSFLPANAILTLTLISETMKMGWPKNALARVEEDHRDGT